MRLLLPFLILFIACTMLFMLQIPNHQPFDISTYRSHGPKQEISIYKINKGSRICIQKEWYSVRGDLDSTYLIDNDQVKQKTFYTFNRRGMKLLQIIETCDVSNLVIKYKYSWLGRKVQTTITDSRNSTSEVKEFIGYNIFGSIKEINEYIEGIPAYMQKFSNSIFNKHTRVSYYEAMTDVNGNTEMILMDIIEYKRTKSKLIGEFTEIHGQTEFFENSFRSFFVPKGHELLRILEKPNDIEDYWLFNEFGDPKLSIFGWDCIRYEYERDSLDNWIEQRTIKNGIIDEIVAREIIYQ